MRQSGQEIAGALDTVDQSILPALSRLLDALIDSAALARPGHDADLRATELRTTAMQVDALAQFIAAVAPFAQAGAAPARISA